MKAPGSLWVVDPSVVRAEDQGVGEILRGWPGTSRIFRPCLSPGDGPGPGTGYETDGVVLMGSNASVHDSPGWLDRLESWLRPLLIGEPERPVLGICFGHQLIAHLAGGRVDWVREDRDKRVGVETTRMRESRLMTGRPTLRVMVSHREEVKQPPPGYRVTAVRDGIPIDGLEHRTLPVFSFQFHPEAREDFARCAGVDLENLDDRFREDSGRVLESFRSFVLSGGD